jgi:hypothetical protein
MIPKSFNVLGHTYKVVIDNVICHENNCHGMFDDKINTIYLATKYKSSKGRWLNYKIDAVEHTFYHELVHCILMNMGEMELYENERFVDSFGGILHQIMITKNENT